MAANSEEYLGWIKPGLAKNLAQVRKDLTEKIPDI